MRRTEGVWSLWIEPTVEGERHGSPGEGGEVLAHP